MNAALGWKLDHEPLRRRVVRGVVHDALDCREKDSEHAPVLFAHLLESLRVSLDPPFVNLLRPQVIVETVVVEADDLERGLPHAVDELR